MGPKIFLLLINFGIIFGNENYLSTHKYIYDNIEEHLNNVDPHHENFDEIFYLSEPVLEENYDFIIVGSGSAGSVIANRLSEIGNWSILLLEAGKGENQISQIPLVAPVLQFSHYNWGYFMEYEKNVCVGMGHDKMHWPRGKALGGSTVINYMIYTRGNKLDYDRWAAQGNPGWSYEEVLPYFIKSENTMLRVADRQFHGTGGYLGTADSYQSSLVRTFIEAGQELGLPYFDYNAPSTFGVSTIQANHLNGRRHSNARAFLQPVKTRRNLHILTSAFVTKLLIDPKTKIAYGVEYERSGIIHRVGAIKEVILSAGTFNSPKLLMLAGIGPREHLNELRIEVLEDLPVGQNMHDHLCFPGLSFLVNETSLGAQNVLTLKAFTDFFLAGRGTLTSLGGAEGIGYIKTEVSEETAPLPDIELLFIGASLASDYGLVTRIGMNIRDDVYYPLFGPLHNKNQWTVFPMLLHPKSIGYLKLRSTSPYEYPLLHGNFFSDPQNHDVKTFIAAIRYIQKISGTSAFQRIGSTLNPNIHPGCERYVFDSDEYWECCLRSIAVTLHHQVGTVKMGPSDDPGAVVNHELKVYGIRNLRVADCSIIPFALGAHTNAPATMIGEKAADLIKQEWGVL